MKIVKHFKISKMFGVCTSAWESIKSKWHSFRSITLVYKHWHNVLKAYLFGERSAVILHDHSGNKIALNVSGENVAQIVVLAKALYMHLEHQVNACIILFQ